MLITPQIITQPVSITNLLILQPMHWGINFPTSRLLAAPLQMEKEILPCFRGASLGARSPQSSPLNSSVSKGSQFISVCVNEVFV